MENLGSALNWLAIAIGALLLVGAAAALVRGSYSKARIQALREDNEDLRARVSDLEGTVASNRSREANTEQRLSHVEEENKLLKDMVTQRANVEAMLDLLEHHHSESMAAWNRIVDAIETGQDDGER
jgi:predicted nuclease with TOPRIM domain